MCSLISGAWPTGGKDRPLFLLSLPSSQIPETKASETDGALHSGMDGT